MLRLCWLTLLIPSLNASFYPPMAPEIPPGGSIRIDLVVKAGGRESELNTIWLNDRNVTILTGGIKLPPAGGVGGEIVPLEQACTEIKAGSGGVEVDKHGRLLLRGESPDSEQVIALIDGRSGDCDWLTRIANAATVANVVGVLIYAERPANADSGQYPLANPQEVETVPAFLISPGLGADLTARIRGTRESPDLDWIRATLSYRFTPSPLMNLLQFILIGVILFILLAFLLSMAVHYRLYRHFGSRGDHNKDLEKAIDEEYLARLPLRRFHNMEKTDEDHGAGIKAPEKQDKSEKAPVEEVQEWLPVSNDLCSVCLDEFVHGEIVNVLPCGHGYHPSCIHPWLLHRAPYCPLCKQDVRQPAEDNPYHQQVPLLRRLFKRRPKKPTPTTTDNMTGNDTRFLF